MGYLRWMHQSTCIINNYSTTILNRCDWIKWQSWSITRRTIRTSTKLVSLYIFRRLLTWYSTTNCVYLCGDYPYFTREDDRCVPTSEQDDGNYEAIPGSDFTVTRIAFRDSSSKYYLNDHLSNFTEVTKKLRSKGVDLDNNRFLILQVRNHWLVVL